VSPGKEYQNVRLYEAEYEPERLQFYRLVDIPFARELRKVSLRHPFRGVDASTASAAGSAERAVGLPARGKP
jgi:hypothetical protein